MEVREVDPTHADARALVRAYFDELRARVEGWSPPRDLSADVTLVAYDGARAIGCGSLRRHGEDAAEVKRMYVVPDARGRGCARLLLRALEARARALGCARVVLDTATALREAAAMYEREGYADVPRYNDNPVAARWFEKRL